MKSPIFISELFFNKIKFDSFFLSDYSTVERLTQVPLAESLSEKPSEITHD